MFRLWLTKHAQLTQKNRPKPSTSWFQRYILLICGIVLSLGLWVALSVPLFPSNDTGILEIGMPSPLTIQAPRSAEFISDVRTNAARAQAESKQEHLVYITDFAIPTEQRTKLVDLLAAITRVRDDPTLSNVAQNKQLDALSSTTVVLTGTLSQSILSLNDNHWSDVVQRTINIYDRAVAAYSFEITEEALQELRERTLPYWTSSVSQPERDLIVFFTASFLRINRTLDAEATQTNKQKAHDSVEPVKVMVQRGENIVRVGDFVTLETIEKARAVGALPKELSWSNALGLGLMSALLSLTFMLYLLFAQKTIVHQLRPLLVITIALIVTALMARLLKPLWPSHPFAFPLATTILVLTVIFNMRVALAGAVLLSVVLGLLDGNTLSTTVTMLIGCTTAVFAVRGADRPITFMLAGVGIAATTTFAEMSFCLFDPGRECISEIMMLLLLSGTNGGLSAILSLGLFNLVGNAAGVVTPLRMMELAHPSQPLLRKIIHEAPGTYYHSIAVSNLAEAAADAVGADALLLRVAAYYHDVGKTLRPFFFTDNQTGRENVHNELDPHTSANIIIDHVREGIKMAKAAGLPQQIVDFIPTHHGTNLVGHFYQLALRQEDSVNIDDFRYPGPSPWTREQGILMLADSVEATVRAKAQHGKLVSTHIEDNNKTSGGKQTLEELVNQIIDDRVRSGQLDNTSLTLKDLVLIRKTFIMSLKSIYHPRTEYVR